METAYIKHNIKWQVLPSEASKSQLLYVTPLQMALCHCIILVRNFKILFRPIKCNESHIIYQYKNKLKKSNIYKRNKKQASSLLAFSVFEEI